MRQKTKTLKIDFNKFLLLNIYKFFSVSEFHYEFLCHAEQSNLDRTKTTRAYRYTNWDFATFFIALNHPNFNLPNIFYK